MQSCEKNSAVSGIHNGEPYDKEKSCYNCPDRVAYPNCHDRCEYHLDRANKRADTRRKKELAKEIDRYQYSNYSQVIERSFRKTKICTHR